jgi:hypothetical protein
MNSKANPLGTVPLKGFDKVGMQRRGPGPGIDFGLDRRDAEFRQRQPFAPAGWYQRCSVIVLYQGRKAGAGAIIGVPVVTSPGWFVVTYKAYDGGS